MSISQQEFEKLRDKIFSHRHYVGTQELVAADKQHDLLQTEKIIEYILRFFEKELQQYDELEFFNKMDGRILLLFYQSVRTFEYFARFLKQEENYLSSLLWIFIVDGLISSYKGQPKSDSNRFADFLSSYVNYDDKKQILMGYQFRREIDGQSEYKYMCYERCKLPHFPHNCIDYYECPIKNYDNEIDSQFKQVAKQLYAIRSSVVHHGMLSSLASDDAAGNVSISDAFIGGRYQSSMGLTSIHITIGKMVFANIMRSAIFNYFINMYKIKPKTTG